MSIAHLREEIAILERRRAHAARIHWLIEHSDRPNIDQRCDWLCEFHDKVSDAKGLKERELFEAENEVGLREQARDRAYGAWSTAP